MMCSDLWIYSIAHGDITFFSIDSTSSLVLWRRPLASRHFQVHDLALLSLSPEESACISHRKGEAQRFLAHEIGYSIVTQHPGCERKCATSCVDSCGMWAAIRCEEVACRDQCESALDGCEDSDIHQIQW